MMTFYFYLIFFASIIIHENAHGLTALWLGDPTAKSLGRITLNPLKHLDPVGSVILPILSLLTTGGVFGYAKPVPISTQNLRGGDRGFAIVALAGPASNVALALVGSILVRKPITTLRDSLLDALIEVNIFLAAFNLLPLPPLDGSRLLRPFLKARGLQRLDRIEPYGFVILFAMIYFLSEQLFWVVNLIKAGLKLLLPL